MYKNISKRWDRIIREVLEKYIREETELAKPKLVSIKEDNIDCKRDNHYFRSWLYEPNKEVKKITKLVVEERGFAAYKYKDLIQEIVKYINENIFNEQNIIEVSQTEIKYGRYRKIPITIMQHHLEIPNILSNRLEELINPQIEVNVTNMLYDDEKYDVDLQNLYGVSKDGAYISTKAKYDAETNKLSKVIIYINLLAVNNRYSQHQPHTVLIHELQHAIEDYNRQKKNEKSVYQSSTDNYRLIIEVLKECSFECPKESQMMSEILYRLWLPHERTAIATEVYSYFKSINAKRENFQKDLISSKSYNSYRRLCDKQIKELDYFNDYVWWFKMHLLFLNKDNDSLKELSESGILTRLTLLNNKQKNEAKAFKNWFIKQSNQYLKVAMRQIGKIASLYYDDSEAKIKEE